MMYSDPMRFADLAPVVGGEPTRALVRQAKAAGTLIERRPHAEPGVSSRRRAHFQTVAAAQALPLQHASDSNADCAGLSEPADMLVRRVWITPAESAAFADLDSVLFNLGNPDEFRALMEFWANAAAPNPYLTCDGLLCIGPGDI